MTKNFIYIVALLFSFTAFSQDDQIEVEENRSIEAQFDYLLEKANSYKEFKVIRKVTLAKFKGEVLDSLQDIQAELKRAEDKIGTLQGEITTLQSNLQSTNGNLDLVNQEKDSINFFGSQTSKASYKTIMWSIVAALLGFLAFFIFRFWRNNSTTAQIRHSLVETQNEFEEHRKRTLEKEQKLMRRLQDELNRRSS